MYIIKNELETVKTDETNNNGRKSRTELLYLVD